MDVLSRPYTVADHDPILLPTVGKTHVDTESHQEGFWDFLRTPLIRGDFQIGKSVNRMIFRAAVAESLTERAQLIQQPSVVFVGGGYGSGKTTVMSMMCKSKVFPFGSGALLGVDYCKLLIPEFERLKRVSDGRASSVCQEEARAIAECVFALSVDQERSFSWDSSMSNFDESIAKIRHARAAGYKMTLVAVLTDSQVAIRRAMNRALETRRFAHPDHLVPSAEKFYAHFPSYCDEFEDVYVFSNNDEASDHSLAQPMLIARKNIGSDLLKVFDPQTFNRFITPSA